MRRAGQVGQEIYGCGSAFIFAARSFLSPGEHAPFLIFAEIEMGSYLLRGVAAPLTLEGVRHLGIGGFLGEAALGSLVVGGALAIFFGALAWLITRRPARPNASSHP